MRKQLAVAAMIAGTLLAGGFALAEENGAAGVIDDAAHRSTARITFPIPELGNCASKNECKVYCDTSAHMDICLSFASSHGLMKSDEVEKARKFASIKGPGGCQGIACKTYCEDSAHADECIAFAQEHKLISPKDIRIAQVIKEGGGPGGCASMSECWNYCADAAHAEACSQFARENGLEAPRGRDADEHADGRGGPRKNFDHPDEPRIDKEKARKILSEKDGPGGCKTMEECGNYCETEGHMDECLRFAQENGLMDKEDIARVKKFVEQPGPGGCRGRACQTYCENEAHRDECMAFAVEHGFMSKEEVERVKKFRDVTGPGGCEGIACKTYCADQSHHDECVAFAVQHGFMTREEADRVKNMQTVTGPGGCAGEECRTYCEDQTHREECMAFAKEHGMMGPPREEGRTVPDHPLPPQGVSHHEEGDRGDAQEEGDRQSADQLGRPEREESGRRDEAHPPSGMTPGERQRYEVYRQNVQRMRERQQGFVQDMQGVPAGADQYRQYQERSQPMPGVRGPRPPEGADSPPREFQEYPQRYPYESSSTEHSSQPYPQQYQGQPGTPAQPFESQRASSSTQYQGSYQPALQPAPSSTPPAGSAGFPTGSAPPPPPAPTSAVPAANLVAAVFSVFSQLLRGI